MMTLTATSTDAEAVTLRLREADEQMRLADTARSLLHQQDAAGRSAAAWMYQDMAEACEDASHRLTEEAAALYRSLPADVQEQARQAAAGCRFAGCLS